MMLCVGYFKCDLFFMPPAEGKGEIRFIVPNLVKSNATEHYIAHNKIKTYPTNGKLVDAVVRTLFRTKRPEQGTDYSSAEESEPEDE